MLRKILIQLVRDCDTAVKLPEPPRFGFVEDEDPVITSLGDALYSAA